MSVYRRAVVTFLKKRLKLHIVMGNLYFSGGIHPLKPLQTKHNSPVRTKKIIPAQNFAQKHNILLKCGEKDVSMSTCKFFLPGLAFYAGCFSKATFCSTDFRLIIIAC